MFLNLRRSVRVCVCVGVCVCAEIQFSRLGFALTYKCVES